MEYNLHSLLKRKLKLRRRANWLHVINLRPHLYGLGYPRQPSPRVTLAEVIYSLQNQPNVYVYIRRANPSRGARQLG